MASRKRGSLCKHKQALLYGEVSNLVDGSDSLIELASMAEGSLLLAEAMAKPAERTPHRPPEGAVCVRTLYSVGCARIAQTGMHAEFEESADPWRAERLALFDHFKNGKRRKTPSFVLSWEEMTGDYVVQRDGSIAFENVRPRERPFAVSGGGLGGRTRKQFADAYDLFIGTITAPR